MEDFGGSGIEVLHFGEEEVDDYWVARGEPVVGFFLFVAGFPVGLFGVVSSIFHGVGMWKVLVDWNLGIKK